LTEAVKVVCRDLKKGGKMLDIKTCTKAIKADPYNAALYLRRGANYQGEGDHDEAIADYTIAIKLKPDYAHAYYLRGLSKYLRKDCLVDKADIIKDLDKAIELGSPVAGNLKRVVMQEMKTIPYSAVGKWVKNARFRNWNKKQERVRLEMVVSGLDIRLHEDPRKDVTDSTNSARK
jgi:tetratricopeptide (TPR) repeat protein